MNIKFKYLIICLLSIIFLISIPIISNAVNYMGTRGDLWVKMSKVQKNIYMMGYHDGLSMAQNNQNNDISEAIPNKSYVEGLDEFYKDYRNKLIPAAFAIPIISLEIQGAEKSEINRQIRMLRDVFHKMEEKKLEEENDDQ